MGQIKGKSVKKAAKRIVEKHYIRLNDDFYNNKLVIKEVAEIATKKLTNKVAGYVTTLIKRTLKGPVKGLYIKQHEEQLKKLEQYVPKVSYLDEEVVFVDTETLKMIKEYGISGKFEEIDENFEHELDETLSEEEEFSSEE